MVRTTFPWKVPESRKGLILLSKYFGDRCDWRRGCPDFPLKEEGLCGSLCSNPFSFGSILFVLLSTNSKLRFQLSDQLRNLPMSTNSVPTSFDKSQSRSNPPQSMVACLPT